MLARDQAAAEEAMGSCHIKAKGILSNRLLIPVPSGAKEQLELRMDSLLLLGGSNGLPMDSGAKDSYSRRRMHVSRLSSTFWRRWLKEYPPSLWSG